MTLVHPTLAAYFMEVEAMNRKRELEPSFNPQDETLLKSIVDIRVSSPKKRQKMDLGIRNSTEMQIESQDSTWNFKMNENFSLSNDNNNNSNSFQSRDFLLSSGSKKMYQGAQITVSYKGREKLIILGDLRNLNELKKFTFHRFPEARKQLSIGKTGIACSSSILFLKRCEDGDHEALQDEDVQFLKDGDHVEIEFV